MRKTLCYAIMAVMFLAGWTGGGPASAQTGTGKTTTKKKTSRRRSGKKSTSKPATSKSTATKSTTTTGSTAKSTAGASTKSANTATGKPGTSKSASSRKKSASTRGVTWRNRQTSPSPERYKEIQSALASKGYLSAEDATGTWNQSSIEALKKFQAEQNLASNGRINSLSLIALGLGPRREAPAAAPKLSPAPATEPPPPPPEQP
jgi:hypothetical protein